MKLTKIISQHRNDYRAEMTCEHCEHVQIDPRGYDDANYHQNVIPAMCCQECGKNRAGESEAKRPAMEVPGAQIIDLVEALKRSLEPRK